MLQRLKIYNSNLNTKQIYLKGSTITNLHTIFIKFKDTLLFDQQKNNH